MQIIFKRLGLNKTFSEELRASSMPFQRLCSDSKHKHKDLPGVESCKEKNR